MGRAGQSDDDVMRGGAVMSRGVVMPGGGMSRGRGSDVRGAGEPAVMSQGGSRGE